MSDAVIIALMICGTLIILTLINNVRYAANRKKINKQTNDFTKKFPSLMETPERKNDDVKFGD